MMDCSMGYELDLIEQSATGAGIASFYENWKFLSVPQAARAVPRGLMLPYLFSAQEYQ